MRRKGQATVLGIIFFLVLLMASVSTIYYFTYKINEYHSAVQAASEFDINRLHEKLVITSAYLNEEGKLVINMTNRGTVTVHPIRLWIINQTDNMHYSYNFTNPPLYLEPGESLSNTTKVTLTFGKDYAIRVVTERGNIASYNLVPEVKMHLGIVAPGFVPTDEQINVVLIYTNNDTSANFVYNLQPTLSFTDGATLLEGPTPASISLLPKDSTAVFRYKFQAPGESTTITFNASFVGAPQGNFVTATTEVGIVAFAEQSEAALNVETAGSAAVDTEGRLYFHDQSVLDGRIMDPLLPTGTAVSVVNPDIKFYTVNDTNTRTIPAGDWNLSIYYKRPGSGPATTVRIIYEVVSQNGSTVVTTIDDFTVGFPRSEAITLWTYTTTEPEVNMSTQERLRLSIIYQSGRDLTIYFDSSSRDSHLQTPIPDPLFPTSIDVESGEPILVRISNPSNASIVVNHLSRIILRSTQDNTTYAGIITDWAETSDPTLTTPINSDQDSRIIAPGDSLYLKFSAPTTIPSRTGDQGSYPPSGTYRLIVHLEGYDSNGALFVRILDFGDVDVV
jgi:hypothetical protein